LRTSLLLTSPFPPSLSPNFHSRIQPFFPLFPCCSTCSVSRLSRDPPSIALGVLYLECSVGTPSPPHPAPPLLPPFCLSSFSTPTGGVFPNNVCLRPPAPRDAPPLSPFSRHCSTGPTPPPPNKSMGNAFRFLTVVISSFLVVVACPNMPPRNPFPLWLSTPSFFLPRLGAPIHNPAPATPSPPLFLWMFSVLPSRCPQPLYGMEGFAPLRSVLTAPSWPFFFSMFVLTPPRAHNILLFFSPSSVFFCCRSSYATNFWGVLS